MGEMQIMEQMETAGSRTPRAPQAASPAEFQQRERAAYESIEHFRLHGQAETGLGELRLSAGRYRLQQLQPLLRPGAVAEHQPQPLV